MFVQDEAIDNIPRCHHSPLPSHSSEWSYATNSGGVIDTWSMTGTLPNGLSFNNLNGEITGTPLDVTTSTVFLTIEAICW